MEGKLHVMLPGPLVFNLFRLLDRLKESLKQGQLLVLIHVLTTEKQSNSPAGKELWDYNRSECKSRFHI